MALRPLAPEASASANSATSAVEKLVEAGTSKYNLYGLERGGCTPRPRRMSKLALAAVALPTVAAILAVLDLAEAVPIAPLASSHVACTVGRPRLSRISKALRRCIVDMTLQPGGELTGQISNGARRLRQQGQHNIALAGPLVGTEIFQRRTACHAREQAGQGVPHSARFEISPPTQIADCVGVSSPENLGGLHKSRSLRGQMIAKARPVTRLSGTNAPLR